MSCPPSTGGATVIAIDGPAGSGKSTLAQGLAVALGLPYVNTGLMYRALTRRALDRSAGVDDGPALAALAGEIVFALGGEAPGTLLVDGRQPGSELATETVETEVSQVSRHEEVRNVMRKLQRTLGRNGAVMEGRDIGTVVFPDATVKIFLVASHEVRAARRIEERGGRAGLADRLAARDAKDAQVNPFVPADDAVAIDNTGRGVDDVLEQALAVVRARLGGST
jgi:cytidylate kinase